MLTESSVSRATCLDLDRIRTLLGRLEEALDRRDLLRELDKLMDREALTDPTPRSSVTQAH